MMTAMEIRSFALRVILRSIVSLIFLVLLAALTGGAQTPVSVPPSHQESIRISYVEPLELVLDEPLSSATAKKGQTVRMQLKEPWVAEGYFIAPAGTPAVGAVRRVERAIPGKRNGRVVITAGSIQLPSGKSVRLNIQMPDGQECDDIGPCLLFYGFATLVELPFLAIELPLIPVGIVKEAKARKGSGTYHIPGEESNLSAGSSVKASNKRPFQMPPVAEAH
jgi:hypothetical protein